MDMYEEDAYAKYGRTSSIAEVRQQNNGRGHDSPESHPYTSRRGRVIIKPPEYSNDSEGSMKEWDYD